MTFPIHIIDLPASIIQPVQATFRLLPEGEVSGGAWSPVPRSAGPRHMRWSCDMQMENLRDDGFEDQRATWDITVARMQGGAIACRLFHPARRLPRGVGAGIWRTSTDSDHVGGSYLIDGAYYIDGAWRIIGGSTIAYVGTAAPRYANALHMTGLVPNATVFHAGDHFETGGNLYMVSANCESDANGEATVPFVWKLWKGALEGDQINLRDPAGRFILVSKETGAQAYTSLFGNASIQAAEVPYVE